MWSFLINKFRFSVLLIISIVISGFFSLNILPKEATPEVKIPYASVMTIYPGASPVDVEQLITDPIEEKVLNLSDVINVGSSSSEGMSVVFVEFDTDADISEKVSDLQDAVNSVGSLLPDDLESPIVTELNYSNMPILALSLSADLSHTELVNVAEAVQTEISSIQNISKVELLGVREKEVVVEIDPVKLQHYGVSIMEVLSAIQYAETSLPLGTIESNDIEYTLRFSAEISPNQISDLIVRSVNSVPIFIRDLGVVEYKLSEANNFARVSVNGSTPDDAITLNIYKNTGGDIVEIVDEVFERVDSMDVMDGIDIFVGLNYADDIRDQLNSLSKSGLQTIVLVAIILFLALGLREAFVAGLAIPLTFLMTFTGLSWYGTSLNFLSLFSLILALGILVDTGIVVTEGMHTKLREESDPIIVALETVREYQWPLISGTLTTVAAFVPMLLMTGIIGEFIKHIPVTVTITLMASLFVGLGILPVIGSRILKPIVKKRRSWFERQIDNTKETYHKVLSWILSARKRQNRLLGSAILLFFIAIALPISGALETVMFPTQDYYLFFIEVQLEKGVQLEETNAVAKEIEKTIVETPEVESFVATVGSSSNVSDGVGALGISSSNLANYTIRLRDERERTSLEIVDEYREIFSKIPNADINVIAASDGPPSASPIDFKITGSDFELLEDYSDEAVAILENIPGAINVASSLESRTSEFVLLVDREAVASVGLSPMTVAQIARISINGLLASTIKVDGEDVNVILQTKANSSINDILALPIATQSGTYSLSRFVDLSFEPAPNTILHSNGDRNVQITADLEDGYLAANVLSEFQSKFTTELEPGYQIEYGGEMEEMIESFQSLGRAMVIGILLIVVILILQFNSFKQAATVLLTIPLALIGVFFGLTILGIQFSFPAFVGVVALSGIVVNNAIILIDRINKNLLSGLEIDEAILEAGKSRYQPILLTSITTVVGIAPLAFSDPTWGPMGYTIICGLIFSTVLTLIVIPSAYKRFVKKA